MTYNINDTQHNSHYAKCCYAECHDLFIVMLNVVMLSVVIPNVIILSVVAPISLSCYGLKFFPWQNKLAKMLASAWRERP